MFVWEHRKQERFDQMNEQPAHVQQQPASFLSSLEATLALRDRIEEESPCLKVLDACAHPSRPFLTVKAIFHAFAVPFSSLSDYTNHILLVNPSFSNPHAP